VGFAERFNPTPKGASGLAKNAAPFARFEPRADHPCFWRSWGERDLTYPRKTRKPVVSESLALSEAEWAESITPKTSRITNVPR
jgi:hypothetical protein